MAITSLLNCLLCGLPKREDNGEKTVSRTQYEIEGKNPGDSTDSQESIDSASQFATPDESKKIPAREAIIEVPIQPSKTNKALIVASKGTYAFADLPFPDSICDGEVLIENRATGLNPIDYKSVDYNFCLPEFPWVTGREMAGVVVRVGKGVVGIKEGDEVWTSTYYRDRRAGCFQHYITVPAHTVLPLPRSLDFTSAACLGVAGLTAAMTLWHWLDVPLPFPSASTANSASISKPEAEKEYLLIWGGSTITGQFATQLSLLSSIPVIAITSSLTAPLALSLGATVIERDGLSNGEIVSRIRSIAGDNITRAIDLVGTKTASYCLQALSSSKPSKFAPLAMISAKETIPEGIEVVTVEMKRFVLDEENRRYAVELNRLVGEGRISMPGIEVLEGGLDVVEVGLERLKGGMMGGRKMVVRF